MEARHGLDGVVLMSRHRATMFASGEIRRINQPGKHHGLDMTSPVAERRSWAYFCGRLCRKGGLALLIPMAHRPNSLCMSPEPGSTESWFAAIRAAVAVGTLHASSRPSLGRRWRAGSTLDCRSWARVSALPWGSWAKECAKARWMRRAGRGGGG